MQSFDNSHGWVVLGIYIKYYEKVLENFKWASDMVWFTFFFKHYLAPVWKADKERGGEAKGGGGKERKIDCWNVEIIHEKKDVDLDWDGKSGDEEK